MIVSVEWLRNYVDVTLSVEELAHRLTMVGLEVEAVRWRNPFLERIVTARVGTLRRHPNADHLHLCEVFDGENSYSIVCGAPNVTEGSTVLLALPGAQLPGGMVIQETQIRGQLSRGMLCSQKELGLGEDASGIWILPDDVQPGISVREALGIDDQILDVAVTPNRSDCLSILGIAREVGAICRTSLRYPEISFPEGPPDISSLASIAIDDPEGCPRYTARILQGVTIGPSTVWMRERLEAVGLRSINNIVDVTNYVLMEMGQPLHAFDCDRLRERRIVVRKAMEGERFTTLDGVERTLFEDTLLICDGRGPVAVAGIMGGMDSEITPKTTRVLIESAYFDPQGIRRSSKKLGLRSESSYRFERGVDPEGVIRALDRAAQLMLEVGGGEVARGRIDVYPCPIASPTVVLDVDRTNRFLGTDLPAEEMAGVLRLIEMPVEALDDRRLEVKVPSFRPDITREVDLAEEVARLVGYDRVPVTCPEASIEAESADPHLSLRQEIKAVLQGIGFFEVLNYSFISYESLNMLGFSESDPRLNPVRVLNPLSEDQGVMRTTLISGLLQTARRNFDRGNEDQRIFELSKVFLPRDCEVLPAEPHHLAGIMTGARSPQTLYGGSGDLEYADIKGVVEELLDLFHLQEVAYVAEKVPPYFDSRYAASILCEGSILGAIGRVHPRVEESFDLKRPVYAFDIDFDRAYALRRSPSPYQSLPRFPSVLRDMALIVDDSLAVQEVLDFCRQLREPMLEQIEVFDIYRNPQLSTGKKSLGYRLVYRSADRSLTDSEVNDIHGSVVKRVLAKFNAVLRS